MTRRKPDTDDDEAEAPGNGHNIAGSFSKERLKKFISKIEKLEEDKRAIGSDIRSVYQEAESAGLDAKVIRKVVADRRKDQEIVTEQEELKRIYKEALGDFSSSPLGEAAAERGSKKGK